MTREGGLEKVAQLAIPHLFIDKVTLAQLTQEGALASVALAGDAEPLLEIIPAGKRPDGIGFAVMVIRLVILPPFVDPFKDDTAEGIAPAFHITRRVAFNIHPIAPVIRGLGLLRLLKGQMPGIGGAS